MNALPFSREVCRYFERLGLKRQPRLTRRGASGA
jgi:hypothetical protein